MIYQVIYADWEAMDGDQRWSVHQGKFLEKRYDLYGVVASYTCRIGKDVMVSKRDCANKVFEKFNIGDHGGKDVRSMSVGDLVVFEDGTALLCGRAGWELVKVPKDFQFNPVEVAFEDFGYSW